MAFAASQQVLADTAGLYPAVSLVCHNKKSQGPHQVAVVGGGLGGLSVAIYLRLREVDVVIYEARERVGGRANRIEHEGFRFDTGPTLLNYPWVFEDLFRAAGRNFYDVVKLIRVEPSIRFVWPDGQSLTFTSDLPRLRSELERMDPNSAGRLLAFMADAETKYRIAFDKLALRNEDNLLRWFLSLSVPEMFRTAVWHSMDSELRRFFPHPRIRAAFGSYAMYLGGSPWTLPGLFSILPYGELAYGLWLPAGGMYALVEAVEQLARELGVRIETRRPVRRILVQSNRVTGVEFADGTRENYDTIVSNVDVPSTQTQLLGGRLPRAVKMTPGVITIYWGIRGKLPGVEHHTIFLPTDFKKTFDDLLRYKKLSDEPAFYVSVASATDSSLAPPECSTVFVLVPCPLPSEQPNLDWEDAAQFVRTRVLERLSRHGISISQDAIAFEQVWTPLVWQKAFGLYDGSAFGAAHNLWQVGPLRFSNWDRCIRGLYYVGASTTPGTGVPMVVLSGKMTAERIFSHAR